MKTETVIKAMQERGMNTDALEKLVQKQSTRIWTDLGGQCACDKHLGMEAMSRLKARPQAKTITTSMTKWSIMNQDEVDYLSAEYCKGGTICESCKS